MVGVLLVNTNGVIGTGLIQIVEDECYDYAASDLGLLFAQSFLFLCLG